MMLGYGDMEVLKSPFLIQIEVISKIKGFGLQFRLFKMRFLKLFDVVSSLSFNVTSVTFRQFAFF